jgi:hypothetical protein
VAQLQTLPVPERRAAEELRAPAAAGFRAGFGGNVAAPDARALYYGAPLPISFQSSFVTTGETNRAAPRGLTTAAAQAIPSSVNAHLGLRYTLLRRGPGQVPLAVRPDTTFDPEDEVALRFEPNDAGSLAVFQRGGDGTWHLLNGSSVARSIVHTVPGGGGLPWPASGNLELFVRFSRQAQSTENPTLIVPAEQAISSNPAEPASYVVSTSTDIGAQAVGFPLTLKRK